MAGPGDIVFNVQVKGNAAGGNAALKGFAQNVDTVMKKVQQMSQEAEKGLMGTNAGKVSYTGKFGGQSGYTITGTNQVQSADDKIKQAEKDAQSLERASTRAFNSAETSFNRLMNNMSRTVNGIRQVFQGLQELGFYLTTFVSAPLMLMFRGGFDAATAFEQQMAKMEKAVQLTPADTKGYADLEQRLRNLSKITPTDINQLGVFAEQAGQLGVEGTTAVYRFVNLINKMAIGTDVAADTIAEDFGRIASAFGMNLNTEQGMSDMEKLASVMDYVAKRTSTDMNGIVTAMQDAAAVGPLLKIPARDVAVMTGMLITSGQDASTAGTILTQFFVQTLQKADKFASLMKTYSRDIVDANGQITGSFQPYKDAEAVIKEINADPVQVLKDTLLALNQTVDEDKAKALKELFGAAGFRGGRVGAMAASYAEFKKMLEEVDVEWDHGTTLQMDYERMLGTTTSAVQIFKNNLNDLAITIGSSVMPIVNQAIQLAIPLVQDLAHAFEGLDSKTKMLVVAIPLVAAVLMPLIFGFAMLGHVVGLVGGGFVSIIFGMGSSLFNLVRWFGMVKKAGGAIPFVAKFMGDLLGVTVATGEAAGGATGGIMALLGGLGKFITMGAGILAIPAALIGALKLLSGFGLDVSTFFNKLADDAKTWGANLVATYSNGLMGGAVRFLSKAINFITGMIARFFESHSPPEAGPLSGIDQWGTNLMNTFLQGFKLADFDILSEVSGYIEQAFEDIAAIQGLDLSGFGDAFIKVREQISELIKAFNDTGQISESILSGIGSNLGSIGKDIQELLRRWLQYKQLQEQLAQLDEKKKTTLKTYDGEIARISKLNISAEQKAELIRKAQQARDDELRKIEEEKKKTQDEADAAKEKLDWQKEYVKAQLDILDLLKKQNDEKKAGSGAGENPADAIDMSGLQAGLGGLGDPVKELGDEFNSWSTKIDNARNALDQFKAGFTGGPFAGGMGKDELDAWQQSDPQGYKTAKDLYDAGKKAGEIWNSIKGPVEAVGSLLGIVKTKTDDTKKAMDGVGKSPMIQALQKIWDAFTANVNVFEPLNAAFAALDQSFKNFGQSLANAGVNWPSVLAFLGGVFAVVFAAIAFVVTEVVNVLALAVGTIGQIIGTIITSVGQVVGGLLSIFGGLWDILVGLFTDNPTKILEGLTKFLGGVDTIVIGLWNLIISTAGQLLGFLVTLVLRILGDLAASIARLLGFPDAATAIKNWVDTAITNIQNFTNQIPQFFQDMANKVKSWVDQIIAWLNPLQHLNFSGSANLNTTGGADQQASGGISKPGKPHLSWWGEGGEQEAIIPLSQLPNIFSQLYGQQAMAGAGAGYVINIHNPVVRQDKDIDQIADAVVRKISKKTNNTSRMG